ncbi:drug/metabolite transporter (DMT)-like permease [Glaciihabitans tibetensis]|uniref:Drug/metabolite transporter (DMT)-like permease n=2 Tax=Glaciihabitans tibetensis TaxID=1266600 RepID=A0A2T0VJ91_9MICO|nr:drug/metabolite transporter (DMT)-like permease [Glaciihabitans tibetensis]
MRVKPAVFMVLAAAFWAGNYVLGSVAVATMTPFDLTYLRWLIAVVPLLVIAQIVERPRWRTVLRAWPLLTGLAVLGMLAYNLFLYEALNFTSAAGASLINAANPAVMALLAVLLVRDRLSGQAVVGIGLSLLGVLVILSGGSWQNLTALDMNFGQLLMLGAVLVFSLYSIWGRVLRSVPPITATAAQAVIVLVVMTPFAITFGVTWPTAVEPLSALLYIGLFPSVGSYVLWNLALRDTRASVAGIYLNLITVFTVAAAILLGETVPPAELVGGVVVIFGVVLTSIPRITLRARRSPLTPRTPRFRRLRRGTGNTEASAVVVPSDPPQNGPHD